MLFNGRVIHEQLPLARRQRKRLAVNDPESRRCQPGTAEKDGQEEPAAASGVETHGSYTNPKIICSPGFDGTGPTALAYPVQRV